MSLAPEVSSIYKRAALLCGALFLVSSLGLGQLRAQDEDDEPAPPGDAVPAEAVAAEEEVAAVPAAGPVRSGGYTPTAEERNTRKSAAAVQLAREGRALLPIVIARKASDETKRSAAEFASFLKRISGATFEVQWSDGKAANLAPAPPTPDIADLQSRVHAAGENSLKAAAALQAPGAAADENLKKRARNAVILVNLASKNLLAAQQALGKETARRAAAPEALPASGIVLGTRDEFAAPELDKALAVHDKFNGREGFAVRSTEKRLLLLGATEKGVPHAVYSVLETLGCRWLATGEHWEIIPAVTNLNFGLDITDRPTIITRVIAFMDGAMSPETFDGKVYDERAAQADWSRRNGLGASLGNSAGHSWDKIVEENYDEMLAHPEYFAEVNGVREQKIVLDSKTGQQVLNKEGKPLIARLFVKLEIANPRVRQMFVEYALKRFRANPDLDMVSLSPTDGGGFSQSAESRKLGSIPDAVYGLANEVARAVEKEFPGQRKMVGVYAYRENAAPPSFPLEPNVYVEFTTLYNMSQYSYAQLFEMWPKKTPNLGYYDYFAIFESDNSRIPGDRVSSMKYLKSRMPYYASVNARAIFGQSSNAWGSNGRGYYVASKLMWNPTLDVDEILADFYRQAYGPAAAVMQRYHERIGKDADTMVTPNLLGQAFRDVDEATVLAKDRPDVLARLRDVKQYLRYEQLWQEAGRLPTRTTEEKAAYRAAVVAALRHAAAMRHTYMVQWNMVADRLGRDPAATIGDISLVIKSKRKQSKFAKIPGERDVPNVWEGVEPQSPQEIEANFQQGLKSLPADPIEEVRFNLSDPVPVVFPPSVGMQAALTTKEDPTRRADSYQSLSARYIFYSFQGEPIQLKLLSGKRFSNGTTAWTLYKPDGKGGVSAVAQGEIPSDKQEYPLSIKVPGPGAYQFEFAARNQGGSIIYDTGKPASVTWSKNGSGVKGFAGAVFYVPKGTRQIHYFYRSNRGGSNTFIQPDGKPSITVAGAGSGEVASIPVPAGMDGKVWRIAPRDDFRSQWFFNIPNIAAASPDSLMVPRDLAIKDGLQLRTR